MGLLKVKQILGKLTDIMINSKVIVFLVVCLFTHLSFMLLYFSFGMTIPGFLNVISAAFYTVMIFRRKYSEKAIVLTYFEILAYSVVSEIFIRGKCGFIVIDVAIIAGLTYLIPSYGKKKLHYQIAGFFACLVIYAEQFHIPDSFMPDLYAKAEKYGIIFCYINIVITIAVVLYTAFIYDTNLSRIQSELDYRSTRDALTGLYNRRYLSELVSEINDDEDIVVTLIDIDHFKSINDSFGHDTGDEVLTSVSDIIKSVSDMIVPVRWGGEEFVLFSRNDDIKTIYESVLNMCSTIREDVSVPDGRKITVTCGITCGKISSFEETVRRADEYLYYGKNNGRNCVIWDENRNLMQPE